MDFHGRWLHVNPTCTRGGGQNLPPYHFILNNFRTQTDMMLKLPDLLYWTYLRVHAQFQVRTSTEWPARCWKSPKQPGRGRVNRRLSEWRFLHKLIKIIGLKYTTCNVFLISVGQSYRCLKIHCWVGLQQFGGSPDEKSGTRRECLSRKTQLCACASCSCTSKGTKKPSILMFEPCFSATRLSFSELSEECGKKATFCLI